MSLKVNGREGIEGFLEKQNAEAIRILGVNGTIPESSNRALNFCDPHFSPESRLQNLWVMAAISEAFDRMESEPKVPHSTPSTKEVAKPSKEEGTPKR